VSGRRNRNFRAGDRSEYLALYGLTRLAFVDPFPRQEDFGVVDMLGILTQTEGSCVYPKSAFFVQVKSNTDDIVFDQYTIRWVTNHMDHPLFVCIANKKLNELALYSTSRIWLALFKKVEPTSLTLKFDSNLPDHDHVQYDNDREDITVHLGPAIIRKTLDELEENPNQSTELLAKWIQQDTGNIARRHLGRIAVRCFETWETNRPPSDKTLNVYYHGPNHSLAEQAITPLLTALARNYIRYQKNDKLDAVRNLMVLLEPYLDDAGRKLVADRITDP
jgi:hypothetical protein